LPHQTQQGGPVPQTQAVAEVVVLTDLDLGAMVALVR